MNEQIINYKCKCGDSHELLPSYLKYVVQYMDMENRATLNCPKDPSIEIPARKLYKDYLKSQPVQKGAV
jgi:hypothetical protein